MIIKDYEELKIFLQSEDVEDEDGIYMDKLKEDVANNNYFLENERWILKLDEEGNYTSYPNEELNKSKFVIRRKIRDIELPEHRHEYMEIVYVLEGNVSMSIEGQDIIMEKGDICIMDKNVKHCNKPLGENDLVINLLLTSKMFDTVFMHLLSDDNYMSNFIINSFYFTNKTKRYIVKNIEKNSFLESVLINLICEYFSDSIRCEGKINGCLLLLFTELSRNLNKYEKIGINNNHSSMKEGIMEYLQREYRDTTLLKAAEHFHFHPNYLSSLVKKEFGKTFKELLGDIRMVEAAKMLRTTEMKVSIIGEEVGYSNEAYFYRQFKKKYNVTPLDYRKQGGIWN